MAKALKAPEVEQRFAGSGNDVVATSPAEFGTLMRTEFEKWGKVARQSGAALN
jgi:hypothetical protein